MGLDIDKLLHEYGLKNMGSKIGQETVLPNQMKVFCLRKEEVPILYQQVQEYLKHGIELERGNIVFDVGANIGLFSLWLYDKFQSDLSIYAFEPIPVLYEILERNAKRFDAEKLKVFPFGLSQARQSITFGYHPHATALSTAYPDDAMRERDALKQAILSNFREGPPNARRLQWFPPFLRSWIIDRELNKIFQSEPVTCELRTLSEVIAEQGVNQIDLLKVDVEKSELDVFLGIKAEDWLKIKQVVVEVHDLENRVEKVTALLKGHGFRKIVVEQESILKGSGIFSIYALSRSTQ